MNNTEIIMGKENQYEYRCPCGVTAYGRKGRLYCDDCKAKNDPRPYDLEDRREHTRLLREVSGYLRTCRTTRCGGDFEGRQFALDTLEELLRRNTTFQFNSQQ